MILEFDKLYLLPWTQNISQIWGGLCVTWCPEASKKAPMLAARPMQTVLTSGRMCRIVSNTAIPAVTDPPGELIYIVMSLFGSTASKYSNCATIKFAISSSTAPPRRIILYKTTPHTVQIQVSHLLKELRDDTLKTLDHQWTGRLWALTTVHRLVLASGADPRSDKHLHCFNRTESLGQLTF